MENQPEKTAVPPQEKEPAPTPPLAPTEPSAGESAVRTAPPPADAHDLSPIVAANIIALRTANKMTQFELGEKLRYSDKAVSKWERGLAIPDAYVLLSISRLFGVSVDYLLAPHESTPEPVTPPPELIKKQYHAVIALLAAASVWALATLLFILPLPLPSWHWFIYAIPTSLLVLFVLSTLWGERLWNFLLLGALCVGAVLSLYIGIGNYAYWQMFLLLLPAAVILFLCYHLRNRPKNKE